MLMD